MASKSKQFESAASDYQTRLNQLLASLSGIAWQNRTGIDTGLGQYESMAGNLINPQAAATEDARAQDVLGQYQQSLSGLFQNPGYTPQEQRGMRLATAAPIASAYGAAQYANTAGARRTGNAGTALAANQQLAREKSRAMSTGLSGLESNFANARREDIGRAMEASQLPLNYGLQRQAGERENVGMFQFPSQLRAGLFNTSVGGTENLLGQEGGLVGLKQQRAMQPGFLKQLALSGIQGLTGGVGSGIGRTIHQ